MRADRHRALRFAARSDDAGRARASVAAAVLALAALLPACRAEILPSQVGRLDLGIALDVGTSTAADAAGPGDASDGGLDRDARADVIASDATDGPAAPSDAGPNPDALPGADAPVGDGAAATPDAAPADLGPRLDAAPTDAAPTDAAPADAAPRPDSGGGGGTPDAGAAPDA